MNELEELRIRIADFAMALIVEAGELLEHFQWLKQSESFELSGDKLEAVAEELADILVYLVRIADQLDIDLISATDKKIEANELKYPADKVRGSARKYTEYR